MHLLSLVLAAGTAVPAEAPAVPWWVALIGPAALWLFSNGVGAINKVIRQRDASGIPVTASLRLWSAVLNVMAGNLDKTAEQKAIATGDASPRPADPDATLPVKPPVVP